MKNLVEKSLKEDHIKSKNYTETQKAKREKRQTWKGLTAEERTERNKKIIRAWKKSKLRLHSFAIIESKKRNLQSKKQNLSVTQIKKIIRLSE